MMSSSISCTQTSWIFHQILSHYYLNIDRKKKKNYIGIQEHYFCVVVCHIPSFNNDKNQQNKKQMKYIEILVQALIKFFSFPLCHPLFSLLLSLVRKVLHFQLLPPSNCSNNSSSTKLCIRYGLEVFWMKFSFFGKISKNSRILINKNKNNFDGKTLAPAPAAVRE